VTAFEVVLLLCGIICVAVSFIMGDSKKKNTDDKDYDANLTEEQKEDIRRQVTDIIDEEMLNASEKTEVSLDKISNTKILEMNEYADNILGEINRNHNEAVFLYDMLNDKAKEVKSTVKDVNVTKKQVEKIQAEVTSAAANPEEDNAYADKSGDKSQRRSEHEFRSMTPEIVREIDMPVTSEYDDSQENDSYGTGGADINDGMDMVSPQELMAVSQMLGQDMQQNIQQNIQTVSAQDNGMHDNGTHGLNRNDEILSMYESGMDSRQIAKELNLGIGEVRLVIDLYKSTK
jgi:DNA-binding NarL/FixJ family response regulator